MKKEFLLNIALLLGINFLIKPIYLFGVDAHIQNIVGPATYGVYFALFNLVFLFQFIIEPGILSYNSRNIAKHPEELGYHLPRILGIKLILVLFFMLACILGFYAWGYDYSLLPLLIGIAINLFLSTTYIYLRSNVAAVGMYRTDSLLSAFDKLLMLVILGTLSWLPSLQEHFDISWLIYGQMVSYVIACLVALSILRNHLGKLRLIFSYEYFIKLIKWSAPFILILLFMSIYNKMDGIMIERMLVDGPDEAGIYAAGYRFVDALNMLGYLVAALLLPMYSSNLKDSEIITDLLHTGLKIMVVGAAMAACLLIFYGGEIMPLIYDDADAYYARVLSTLMISFVGVSIAYLFGTLLVANDNLKSFNILLFVSVVINLVLNFLLIPSMKAEGAAIATAVTQIMVMIGQIVLVYLYTEVKFDWKIYVQILGFSLLCIFVFAFANALDVYWLYRCLGSICISAILALVFGLVDISAILAMIKKRPT